MIGCGYRRKTQEYRVLVCKSIESGDKTNKVKHYKSGEKEGVETGDMAGGDQDHREVRKKI